MEYVTKWAEALATKTDDAKTVAKLLYENIIIRFGCPKELVSDRGTHFINKTIEQLTMKYLIKHRKSTPYHPRANGQTEKTNGILCKIITMGIRVVTRPDVHGRVRRTSGRSHRRPPWRPSTGGRLGRPMEADGCPVRRRPSAIAVHRKPSASVVHLGPSAYAVRSL
jgi:hypothetical protein